MKKTFALVQLLVLGFIVFGTAVFAQSSVLEVIAQADSLTCHGDDNGELYWQILGGSAPYTYEWKRLTNSFVFASGQQEAEGPAGPLGDNLEANTYIIVVRDITGNEAADTVTIFEPDRILVTDIAVQNPSCVGSCDGSIQMAVEGGTGVLTTQWNDDLTAGLNRDELCPGGYLFFIVDERACRQKGIIDIVAPSPIEIETTITPPSCLGATNGAVVGSATGGTGELVFAWSDGQDNAELIAVGSGQYMLTVTDASACTAVTTVEVPDGLALDANLQVSYGCGDGQLVVSTQPINGTPPYTYNWSTGSSAPWLFQMTSGTYDLSLMDANGCSDELTFTLDFVPPLEIEEEVQDVSCPGDDDGAANLSISGGLPPYTINWADSASTFERVALSAGAYDYNVTASGCALSGVVFVEEPSPWQLELILTPQTDDLLTVTALVSGGSFPYQYQWSNGDIGMSASDLDPTQVYTLLVTDSSGCQQEWDVRPILTGLSDVAGELPVEVYPNPSTGLFYLKYNNVQPHNYAIYAVDGKVIQTGEAVLIEQHGIDLSDFPTGIYRLVINDEGKTISLPLIKH